MRREWLCERDESAIGVLAEDRDSRGQSARSVAHSARGNRVRLQPPAESEQTGRVACAPGSRRKGILLLQRTRQSVRAAVLVFCCWCVLSRVCGRFACPVLSFRVLCGLVRGAPAIAARHAAAQRLTRASLSVLAACLVQDRIGAHRPDAQQWAGTAAHLHEDEEERKNSDEDDEHWTEAQRRGQTNRSGTMRTADAILHDTCETAEHGAIGRCGTLRSLDLADFYHEYNAHASAGEAVESRSPSSKSMFPV